MKIFERKNCNNKNVSATEQLPILSAAICNLIVGKINLIGSQFTSNGIPFTVTRGKLIPKTI
jgi:hypothetical protein